MSSIFNVLDLKCLRISLRMQKYRNVTVTQFKNKARCRVWSCQCTGGSYTPPKRITWHSVKQGEGTRF